MYIWKQYHIIQFDEKNVSKFCEFFDMLSLTEHIITKIKSVNQLKLFVLKNLEYDRTIPNHTGQIFFKVE